jgi:outer membrane receptor protein involved in Fe transport
MRLLAVVLAAVIVTAGIAFAQIAPMEIVTTPTRSVMPVEEESADTVVVTQDDLRASGQPAIDDALRPLPGFNPFRRSSSLVTAPADDPEAQGITLRGVGPGGASRALVLYDGVPVNDAFGGWIYWDEIPLDSVESVEIVNGAVPLWGSGAEGGVINILPERAVGRGLQISSSYGTRNTFGASILAGYQVGPFQLQFDGAVFNTGGWNIVAPAYRGPIDHNSSSFHGLNSGRIQYRPNDRLTLFVAGHYYDADRDLGTPFRMANANRYFLEGGGSIHTQAGTFGLVAYSHISRMDQTYSIVNQPRTAEIPQQAQRVPATDVGGSLTWSKTIFAHNQLLAGSDLRWIDGQSDDSYYNTSGSAVNDRKVSSGRQDFFGAFLEDVYRPSEKFEADLSLRTDVFQNLAGQIRDNPVGGKATVTDFVDRTRTATSPRLGLRYAPWRSLTLRGGLYEAFRAPTLAELYRQSSVESLVLLPNPKLAPEFLQGGEIGLELTPVNPFTLALIGYWNILRRPIGNIVTATNPVTGADAERTRVNLGRAQIRGYEIKADYDLSWVPWRRWSLYHPSLRLGIDYLRSEAALTYNPPDPTFEGRRLALVPWNTGTGAINYQDDLLGQANVSIAFQGMQWEDSDNHDRQRAYWLVNFSWSHALPSLRQLPQLKEARIFAQIQNALDHSYVIDRGGGIPKLGTPFMLEGGFTAPLWF